jgi:hypothetical protein
LNETDHPEEVREGTDTIVKCVHQYNPVRNYRKAEQVHQQTIADMDAFVEVDEEDLGKATTISTILKYCSFGNAGGTGPTSSKMALNPLMTF